MAEDDQLIAGRYRLSARVGSGAMGVVWRAEDQLLRRTVALKQVRLPGGVDDQTRDRAYRRVMREGRLFARLHHPNAIAVFDVVDHAAQPWLVMEYLPSQSLAEAVAARGVLSPRAAASVGHQVAAALTAAHTAGIVHRDVKPGNVLLGPDDVVKVTDFGISRAIDESTVTSAAMMAGTPAYLAPEVARGAEADFRSDVYSLGSTLYAAMEGEPPFGQGDNALAQLHRVATGEYTSPQRAGFLTSLLERLLADDPTRRPEMHQVRDELGRLAAVEAETEEWAEEWTGEASGATDPTFPVAATPAEGLGRAPRRGGSTDGTSAGNGAAERGPGPGADADDIGQSGSGIVPLADRGAGSAAGGTSRRLGPSAGTTGAAHPGAGSRAPGLTRPVDGAPHRVAGAAEAAPTSPSRPRSATAVATATAPTDGPDTEVASTQQPDSADVGRPGRPGRRRLLVVGAAALLLILVVVAVVLGDRSGREDAAIAGGAGAGAAPSAADRPGVTGTDQAPGSGSTSGEATAPTNGSGTGGGAAAAAPAPGTPEQVAQQQAIIDYYGLIPSNLQAGWQRLTPSYQLNTAGGFGGYTRFWGAIRQTTVRGVSPGGGDTVDATVTYVDQGGRTSEERTLFRMVQRDGLWEIDGSQVLSSR